MADDFVLAIAHHDGVATLDKLVVVKAPCSPTDAVKACVAVLRRYGCTRVTGDRYAAQFTVDAFNREGIAYEPSPLVKSDLYAGALPIIVAGKCSLLDHERMASQFCALERRHGRSRDAIDHPPKGHDDLANAVAGALTLAAQPADFIIGPRNLSPTPTRTVISAGGLTYEQELRERDEAISRDLAFCGESRSGYGTMRDFQGGWRNG